VQLRGDLIKYLPQLDGYNHHISASSYKAYITIVQPASYRAYLSLSNLSLHTTPATRFDSFNFYRTSYKKINEHEIEVNVLVSKGIKAGKHPVMVRWHGGGLVSIRYNP